MPSLDVFSPAKLNLFLAITGRRPDGFHNLVSVVVTVRFGDNLTVAPAKDGRFLLVCNDPSVPLDGSNLILRAAEAFRKAGGGTSGASFVLQKRIPMGAGLGGGSSNAVAALLGLNQLATRPLPRERLEELAASLGSDCPLFLHGGPLVMRGRGERVEQLAEEAARRLSGRRVLLFKPGFGIATAWAYGRMAAGAPGSYLPEDEAESRLRRWRESIEPAEKLLYNNMEPPAFGKHIALPALLERIQKQFRFAVGMSGSGSACFALLREDSDVEPVKTLIRSAWGEHTFAVDTEIV